MLRKLIKYDLKWILKLILIYCSLGIFFAITGRLFGLIENSIFFDIISKVCNGISIAMLINAIVNAVIRGWVRVIFNLYRDESYLTHTLPLTKNRAKIIATFFFKEVLYRYPRLSMVCAVNKSAEIYCPKR